MSTGNSKLLLYKVVGSTSCMAVELLVRKLGLDIERIIVDAIHGEHEQPPFLKVINFDFFVFSMLISVTYIVESIGNFTSNGYR